MRKLFALLVSLCLLLSLAACGEPAEDTQPKDTEPGKTTQPQTTEPGTTEPKEEVRFFWDEEGSEEVCTLVEMLCKDLQENTEISLTMDVTDKGQILSLSNGERNQQAQVEYDEKGFPTAIKVTEDGTVITTVNFTFDANGNLLKVTSPEYQLDTSYTYDDNGNVLTITNPDSTEECTYDENGNELTRKRYASNGKLWEYTYTYDADGNQLTGKVTLDGELWSERSNTYENGNLISEINGSDEYRSTYDAQGNLLTYDFYRDGEFVWNQTYTYDADGNCTSESADGELKYESVYTEGGRHVITKSYRQGYMVTRTTEYTYDELGNELSKIIYDSDNNATDQWTSSYKTFSLTDAQAKVFNTLLEYLDELDLIYNG